MNFLENLLLQARYSQWVNWCLYDACATLPDAERKQDRGVFFGLIHGTWNHCCWAIASGWLGYRISPCRINVWIWSYTPISPNYGRRKPIATRFCWVKFKACKPTIYNGASHSAVCPPGRTRN